MLTSARTLDTTTASGGDDTVTASGGDDTVTLGDGDNLVFGGLGADQITTGLGRDTILGDNGVLTMDASGAVPQRLASTDLDLGGGDLIRAGGGDKTILGGAGADTVLAGVSPVDGLPVGAPAARVVFGDAGEVVFSAAGLAISFQSLSGGAASGGADLIRLGDGDSVIVGGAAGDTIATGDGSNVVLGDDGQLLREADGLAWLQISSRVLSGADPAALDQRGGDDQIGAGNGRNIVIAGFGADRVRTGTGADLAFGDNVRIDFKDGMVAQATSTDLAAASGGDDELALGDGDNTAIGGVGSDTVTTGAGRDTVLGDGGTVRFDAAGRVVLVGTGDPTLGSDDTLVLGDGDDVALGGAGNDSLQGDAGRDTLVGDGAKVAFTMDGLQMYVLSIDVTIGGNDRLDGGAGIDVLVGGQGKDLMVGGLAEDLMFGSNAAVTVFDGQATAIQADTHDLSTSTLFALYGAADEAADRSDEVQANVDRNTSELKLLSMASALSGPGSALAANALRNLFRSTLGSVTFSAFANSSTRLDEPSGAPVRPTPPRSDSPEEPERDVPAPTGTAQQLQPALAQITQPVMTLPAEATGTAGDREVFTSAAAAAPEVAVGDAGQAPPLLLAASGAALLAHRGLLDRQAMLGSRPGLGGLSRRALDSVTRKWFDVPDGPPGDAGSVDAAAAPTKAPRARIDW